MDPRKLRELGLLLQLGNQAQQPDLERQQLADRAEAQRQQQAIALMGLFQNMTEADANAQFRNSQTTNAADELARRKQAGVIDTLTAVAQQSQDPRILESLDAYLGTVDPTYGKLRQGRIDAANAQKATAATNDVQSVYRTQQKNPTAMQQGLDMTKQKFGPEVFNGLDWDTLNSMLIGDPSQLKSGSLDVQVAPRNTGRGNPGTPGGKAGAGPRVPAAQPATDFWNSIKPYLVWD